MQPPASPDNALWTNIKVYVLTVSLFSSSLIGSNFGTPYLGRVRDPLTCTIMSSNKPARLRVDLGNTHENHKDGEAT